MSKRFYFSACLALSLCLALPASAKEVKAPQKSAAAKATAKTITTKAIIKSSAPKTSLSKSTAKATLKAKPTKASPTFVATKASPKASATKAALANVVKKDASKNAATKTSLASSATKTSLKAKQARVPLATSAAKASLKSSALKTPVKAKTVEAVAQKKPLAKTELAQTKKPLKPETPKAKIIRSIALFAVSQSAKGASIDPIVVIQNGRFTSPPTSDATTAQVAKFANSYYRAGQKYHLLFGGGDAGNVIVKHWNLRKECSRTEATAEIDSTAKISGKVMGLATDSKELGKKERSRRFPTEKEKEAIYAMAEKAYKQKGVTEAELKDLKKINITATDLNGDGKAEIIGTFLVKKATAAKIAHVLFLIAEPNGKTYKVGVSQYGQIAAKDVGGTDKLDELGESALAEILVDQIDLDKDGTAEVIIADLTAEGVAYKIFKKQKNLWRKAYEFYNLRCAS